MGLEKKNCYFIGFDNFKLNQAIILKDNLENKFAC